MRKFLLLLVSAMFMAFSFSSCTYTTVPAGNVGIKFYLLGGKKGVDYEIKSPGRYFLSMNQKMYLYPTFTQNYTWTKSPTEGSPNDESFSFQDSDGLNLNADVGITYHLDPKQVPQIFQKYKRGIAEITDVFLRSYVRDALVARASQLDVEYIYGKGRAALLDSVSADVRKQVAPIGIKIDKLSWLGRIRLPDSVRKAIDAKINATQIAQQRENEVRQAEAEARKKEAVARGDSAAIVTRAAGQAEANRVLDRSLTNKLLTLKYIEKWNGEKSKVVAGKSTGMILDLGSTTK